jgi:hypothetical protein
VLSPARWILVSGENVTPNVVARDLAGAEVPNVVPVYSSSNAGVAQSNGGNSIVAVGPGTATIRATAGGQSAEMTLHVGAPYDLGALGPPRALDANYIDLSKIARISRFRSTVGHSYVDGTGETCRSKKHYFEPSMTIDWTSVDIYAPATGVITGRRVDGFAGFQVGLRPLALPALNVALFHVNANPDIVVGTWVEAGAHLGRHASRFTMSDIAMNIGSKEQGTLLSYFDVMTDNVFSEYRARGVLSREAAVITRAERDADPVPCVGEQQFTVFGTLPDWLVLN